MDLSNQWGIRLLVYSWALGKADKEWQDFIPRDTLVIPFAIALGFNVLRIMSWGIRLVSRRRSNQDSVTLDEEPNTPVSFKQAVSAHARNQNGWTIYLYAVARFIGCMILLGLSSFTLLRSSGIKFGPNMLPLLVQNPETYIFLTYLYSSFISLTSLSAYESTVISMRYNTLILLSAFSVYVYRDIWPLATYNDIPVDASEGILLWIKLSVLFITAAVIPLFVPTKYTPADPKNPMPEPNPEQTASWFSFVTFSFLDPIIFLGARTDHLSPDQLPPLRDTDASENLIKKAFSLIDPFKMIKPRHLFFRLMRVFGKHYALIGLCHTLRAFVQFLSPIAIYRVLNYLENGGVGDNMRPWFWILILFVGPVVADEFSHIHLYIATTVLTHAEALITELIFEHSLRIRFTAKEASGKSTQPDEDSATVIGTPSQDNASTVDVSLTEDESECGGESQPASATKPSSKGKDKVTTPSPVPAPVVPAVTNKKEDGKQGDKKDDNLIGRINNLVTSDLNNITGARDFLFLVWAAPLQIILCTLFLYRLLGWSSFIGTAFTILLIPAPGYAAKLTQDVQRKKMKKTDARVQAVTEVVNVLRMVKLFGWEEKMSKRIREARDDELNSIWWLKVLQSITGIINSIIPTISMLITYTTYTVVMKQQLTPSIIFSSLTVFSRLQLQLSMISWQISSFVEGKVSLERVDAFLRETELLDAFADPNREHTMGECPSFNKDVIGFKDCSFAWSVGAKEGSSTPSRRSYRLRINDELFFKPNCINLIIGPTGSGKTSMLMALLGEMHFVPDGPDSWFNLPRENGVAYATQESWVQNETIRSNILFGSPYDEVRYCKVLHQCALDKDLSLFEAGDNTEVGEKGITLSGGQKARVTLARAVYSQAQVILLDDILAALDVHTAAWIVEKCLKGDLIKDRTVLLVTHNITLVSPLAKYIVSIGQDGVLSTQSTSIDVPLASDPILANEAKLDKEELNIGNQEVPSLAKKEDPAQGKLIIAEEVAKGHVTWKSLKLFLSGLGGKYPILFFALWIFGLVFTELIYAFQTWFLGYWGSQYENHDPSEVRVSFYCSVYSLIVMLTIVASNAHYFLYVTGSMRASRTINTQLVESVLRSTLRWLDQTPTARIIARFTQDIQKVDGAIASGFLTLISVCLAMVSCLGIIMIFSPVFIFPGILVAVLGFYVGNMYLKAQLSAMREKSNARSPVLAHFSAAVAGVVSVRAYGAQAAFRAESLKRIDHYTRMSRTTYNLNRWIDFRIDLLGVTFSVALAAYLVYGRHIGASNTGFSLNMSSEFCTMILLCVRFFNDFEVQSNSLERIQSYIDIEHEPKNSASGDPPAAWPTSGDLRVENLSARYSRDGPTILHGISFHVESGQRIGIVGRTGSGKSSLTLALLRCIITEGTVYYDGIPTNTINLDVLRSNITIIPQVPELISGTLRRNLDPFDQYDDAALNDALRSAGLFSLQDELGEARITLDTNITIGGGNLSVGEKQILALARAMIRGSKLLILDEATSAIDYKTDAVIQATLRHELNPDVTVLTVAHRLQTIMDADKIMVLDDGRIREFDTPKALLEKETSLFKALVDESGDKLALYAIAESKGAASGSSA
ncbi:multidrug resistance-associated ABC transporter [Pholiota conissans]|uniref:Multidrug resistance-associated ABC transporter n=1 Tax=Pholiota conissans TaxID=109636 RepID=A0A9P6CVU0_9AGAR|nr:multidrug resistance-associated ABC transporter [Pholiota conissans]